MTSSISVASNTTFMGCVGSLQALVIALSDWKQIPTPCVCGRENESDVVCQKVRHHGKTRNHDITVYGGNSPPSSLLASVSSEPGLQELNLSEDRPCVLDFFFYLPVWGYRAVHLPAFLSTTLLLKV